MRKALALLLCAIIVFAAVPVSRSHAAGNCAIYRSWAQGDRLTAADLTASMTQIGVTNQTLACTDDYSSSASQMQTTEDPYPAGAVSLATSAQGEITRLRYVLYQVAGWSQWYTHSEATAIPAFNWTFNGDAEIYGAGTSAAPTGWTLAGAAATAAKNTTAGQFKVSTASVSLTRAGADATLYQDIDTFSGWGPVARWQSKTITVGAWVRATVASRARLQINDGVGTTSSSYHTGGSTFERLQVTRTLDAAATRVRITLSVDTGDTTAQFDGVVVVYGRTVSDWIPSGWRGRKAVLQFGHGAAALSVSTSYYLSSAYANGNELDAEIPLPFKGVARNLQVSVGTTPGGGNTDVFTLRKNSGNTSLTATVTAGNTTAADNTNEAEYAKGDTVDLLIAVGATATTGTTGTVEYEEIP